MKKCNECGGTWVSQADCCIHCDSKDIKELSDEEAPWSWKVKKEIKNE